MSTIRIPTRRQGQTGRGQGGFTSYLFATAIDEPVTIALRSAIPLETDLDVVHVDERWHLVDPSSPETVIMEATRWTPDYTATEPVSVADAKIARGGFPLTEETHPAPHCLSCGLGPDSLRVHAGPMSDGRWAAPLRIPAPAEGEPIDHSLVWMAMDCCCGWFISHSSKQQRQAVTVQLAVDVYEPIEPETDYALVAWHGDYSPDWDGRKRGAAAAIFAADGRCVAQSRSFWVAPK